MTAKEKQVKRLSAWYKCTKCGKVVSRSLGRKRWTPSFCVQKGIIARLYLVSAAEIMRAMIEADKEIGK